MKEKIIEILDISISAIQLVNDDDPIELYGFDSAADAIMKLINQEVEKRIAERMPSKIELVKEYPTGYAQLCLLFKWDFYKLSEFEKDILRQISDGNKKRVDVYEEVRSRLTCSEKPNNSEQQMWRDIQEGERELPE